MATQTKNSTTPTPTSTQSQTLATYNNSRDAAGMSPFYTPSTYNVKDYNITSQPDIVALVNGAMLQLVGRAATPQEIAQYGTELLAAERANPGMTSTTTTYQTTGAGVGKKGATTGSTLNVGVSPTDFIDNLIRGTADARVYQAASQYFDAMRQSNDKYKGAFNG